MNVAYILNNTTATNGDTKAFLNLLQGVIGRGIHPFVIMPDKNGIYHELERNSKVRIKTFNYRTCAYPRLRTAIDRLYFVPKLLARIIVNWKASRQLATYLKENAIDIVHTNVGVVRIGFNAAQRNGIPHIYHIREYSSEFGIHYFPAKTSFLHQLDDKKSYSICITKAIQRYYQQAGKRKQSRVIYDGVFSKRDDMPESQEKNYFLFAGRIQPAKGLDQLLMAYKLYTDKEAHPLCLKIAGSIVDENYSKKQTKFVEEHRLSGKVEFMGNRDDIADLMRKARALVVASPLEGFGFCMPEAQQQGCLVIARNTGGTKEQLDNALDIAGQEIALRYESTEQLAGLLSEVANHPLAFYGKYIQKAFTVVNQLYTTENHVDKVCEFYHDILSDKNH